MLRIAMVALVLSTAPAWAFKPLVCEFALSREMWRIDSKSMTNIRDGRIALAPNGEINRLLLTNYERIGSSVGWRIKDAQSWIGIRNRREIELIEGSTLVRGTCREATLRDPTPE